MATPDFTHLHVHSHYSLLDGVAQIPALVKKAKALGMHSLALTDHGNMFGAVEFHNAARKEGIRPILGMEAYIAPGARTDHTVDAFGDHSHHLILWAENYEGYQNLCRLSSTAYIDGFYHRARIDKEVLAKHSRGLICSSACISGEVNRHLVNGRVAEAERAANEFKDIFGPDRFFLEVQRNESLRLKGEDKQERIIEPLMALSRRTGLSLLPTSDVHYVEKGEEKLQDILICIGTVKKLADTNRMTGTGDLHLKSAEEMERDFPGDFWREALERSSDIARRCNVEIPQGDFHLPRLTPPDGMDSVQYFDKLCREGLVKRYGDPLPENVAARYAMEKDVIVRMGFPDYFLIVWDVVNFAHTNGIWVGPGRGSAAGSIVAYALGITNMDPLRYDLLFERFLNVGRLEMPDIDLDFDKERRQEVVQHIIETHGQDRCAKIVTFGKIMLKSGLRDVARVMGYEPGEVNKWAKLLPDVIKRDKEKGDKTNLDAAFRESPDFKALYDGDVRVKEVVDLAAALDGVIRQTGIHAAGVLVADRPITDYGPLAARDGEVTTQYAMGDLTVLGLCKIDVLGLETLTLLRKALDNVADTAGQRIPLDGIPLDDEPTYAMLGRGDTKGVFQFESGGFRDLLSRMKPDCFEDLIAAVAMFRPGPMQYIDTYIARKHGRQATTHLHPLVGDILNETYGLAIYQEQVQALAQRLADFSLAEGDLMRRAMGKKKKAEMDSYRAKFIEGASVKVGAEIAAKVFDFIEPFAGYGFNKSHSACYALIAYQTAYLKCHYPREYMAALLTTNAGDADKVALYREDAKRMGIRLLPPSINESGANFTVVGPSIRYGLAAVKGVGEKAVEAMAAERAENGPFKNIFDLCERMDARFINKGLLEALVKAGAFDEFGDRARHMAAVESALGAAQRAQRDRASGQMGLFGAMVESAPPPMPVVPAWPEFLQLQYEKEVLGFYISSHPLASEAWRIKLFATIDTAGIALKATEKAEADQIASDARLRENTERLARGALTPPDDASAQKKRKRVERLDVCVGGLIAQARIGVSKKNNTPYGMFTLEDLSGTVQVMVFETGNLRDPATGEVTRPRYGAPPRGPLLERVKGLLEKDAMVFVTGELDLERDEPCIIADNVVPMAEAEATFSRGVMVSAPSTLEAERLASLVSICQRHPGPADLYVRVRTESGATAFMRSEGVPGVRAEPEFVASVEGVLGAGSVRFTRHRF